MRRTLRGGYGHGRGLFGVKQVASAARADDQNSNNKCAKDCRAYKKRAYKTAPESTCVSSGFFSMAVRRGAGRIFVRVACFASGLYAGGDVLKLVIAQGDDLVIRQHTFDNLDVLVVLNAGDNRTALIDQALIICLDKCEQIACFAKDGTVWNRYGGIGGVGDDVQRGPHVRPQLTFGIRYADPDAQRTGHWVEHPAYHIDGARKFQIGKGFDGDTNLLANVDLSNLAFEDAPLGINFRQIDNFQQVFVGLDRSIEQDITASKNAVDRRGILDPWGGVPDLPTFNLDQRIAALNALSFYRFDVHDAAGDAARDCRGTAWDRFNLPDRDEGLLQRSQLRFIDCYPEVCLGFGGDLNRPSGRGFALLAWSLGMSRVWISARREKEQEGRGGDKGGKAFKEW